MPKVRWALIFLLLASAASAQEAGLAVVRVVDGDTLDVERIGVVRLIGVDTPETVDPRKSVQYFGRDASDFLTKLVDGKRVRLEYDQQRKDTFNSSTSKSSARWSGRPAKPHADSGRQNARPPQLSTSHGPGRSITPPGAGTWRAARFPCR